MWAKKGTRSAARPHFQCPFTLSRGRGSEDGVSALAWLTPHSRVVNSAQHHVPGQCPGRPRPRTHTGAQATGACVSRVCSPEPGRGLAPSQGRGPGVSVPGPPLTLLVCRPPLWVSAVVVIAGALRVRDGPLCTRTAAVSDEGPPLLHDLILLTLL